jgi:hypothetical protein
MAMLSGELREVKGDQGWRMACLQMVSNNYISGSGDILVVAVRSNCECHPGGGLKHGWIYRFFPCTGSGLAGRPSCEDRPTCRSQGSSRRSGRFPALPYPPLKQMVCLDLSASVVKRGVSRFRFPGGL